MILELDIGNSRIKWRKLGPGQAASSMQCCASLNELKAALEASEVRYRVCRVCLVRSAQKDKSLVEGILRPHVGGMICFAESRGTLAGVETIYFEPRQLGVDRWLAVVAGHNETLGPSIIVDAGTAITADFVDGNGRHLGGMIAPGYRQMEGLLLRSTGLMAGMEAVLSGPQINTEDCLVAGIQTMLQGFVEQVCNEGVRLFGNSYHLILTGGDAGIVASRMQRPHKVIEDLVFKGLALACPVH